MSNASPSFHLFFDPKKEECLYLLGVVWRKNYLTENTYILLVFSTVISLIAVLPTILLNSLVILAVTTRRRLQSNSNMLLAGLVSTDLLTGLVVQPIRIAVEMNRILGVGPFCTIEKMFAASLVVANIASLCHLVLISVDRYIAIKYSLKYQSLVTKHRILIGELLSWAFIMLVAIPEIMLAVINVETKIFMQLGHAIPIIICTVFLNVVIYTNCYIFFRNAASKATNSNRTSTTGGSEKNKERPQGSEHFGNHFRCVNNNLSSCFLQLRFYNIEIFKTLVG